MIVETAADAIVTWDTNGIVRSFNPAAERLFGHAASEMIGRHAEGLFVAATRKDSAGLLSQFVHHAKERHGSTQEETLARRKDGSTVPIEVALSEMPEFDRFTAIVHVIPERRRYEALMADVAVAEQMRIGRDLHDTVGQDLAALALSAERASRRLECRPCAGLLEETASGIRNALAGVRAAARGMTRVAHDAPSLFVALEELAALTESNYRIRCRLELQSPGSVPDEVADHLYRIASEAVANAAHHARATRIYLSLAREDGSLTLRISDDGIGIPERPTRRGIGTWIMRSRAAAIEADLEIGKGASGGTVVTCRLNGIGHGIDE